MAKVMSKEDFQSVRSVLRWAGMGAQPSPARAATALEVIRSVDGDTLNAAASVMADVGRGVMVSQVSCRIAETQLTELYRRPSNDEGSGDAERQRG